MARYSTLALLALGAAAPGVVQQAVGQEGAAQEWKVEAEATLAASALDDSPLAPAGDRLLADFGVVLTHEDVLDSGMSVGWRFEARAQHDASRRPSFSGVLGDCSPLVPACPRVADGAGFLSPVSPTTGISAGGSAPDAGLSATIESAALTLGGAWGEVVTGFDAGAAVRLDARPPTVLRRVSATSSSLDPTALVITRARNDATGSSAKLTYLSPRWLGLRAGASYTPNANHRSADFDPDVDEPGLSGAELENVWEGGLSFARRFPQSGVRVRASVTATYGESGSVRPEFGDYEAWGAGLELDRGPWTVGLRWLGSDNAWTGPAATGSGDYTAWEIGLVREGDRWRIGVEAGWAEDELGRIEGASWLIGASRRIGDNLRLGAGWMHADADLPVATISPASTVSLRNARNSGLVVELSVGNW